MLRKEFSPSHYAYRVHKLDEKMERKFYLSNLSASFERFYGNFDGFAKIFHLKIANRFTSHHYNSCLFLQNCSLIKFMETFKTTFQLNKIKIVAFLSAVLLWSQKTLCLNKKDGKKTSNCYHLINAFRQSNNASTWRRDERREIKND